MPFRNLARLFDNWASSVATVPLDSASQQHIFGHFPGILAWVSFFGAGTLLFWLLKGSQQQHPSHSVPPKPDSQLATQRHPVRPPSSAASHALTYEAEAFSESLLSWAVLRSREQLKFWWDKRKSNRTLTSENLRGGLQTAKFHRLKGKPKGKPKTFEETSSPVYFVTC